MSGAGYIMPAMAGGLLSIGYTHVDAHEAAQTWITAVKLMKEKGICNNVHITVTGQVLRTEADGMAIVFNKGYQMKPLVETRH